MVYKVSVLDKKAWNRITLMRLFVIVYKLLVLGLNTWNYMIVYTLLILGIIETI